MEEEDPAAGDERRRDQGGGAVREAPAEERHEWQARHRKRRRDEPEAAEAEPEMGDGEGEQEVERRASTLAGHVLDDAGEAVAADEQRQRLVLVWRPRHQLVQQEGRRRDRDRADPEPEPVRGRERTGRIDERAGAGGRLDGLCHGLSGRIFAGRLPP